MHQTTKVLDRCYSLLSAAETARAALLRVQPQIQGALPRQDVETALRELDRALAGALEVLGDTLSC
ncbi:hypothetical protein [Thiomonas sp.]